MLHAVSALLRLPPLWSPLSRSVDSSHIIQIVVVQLAWVKCIKSLTENQIYRHLSTSILIEMVRETKTE